MIKFLQKKAKTTYEKLANIAYAYIINVVWTLIVATLYKWLFAPVISESGQMFSYGYKHEFLIYAISTVIFAPFFEEILFRHLPLQIIKKTNREDLLLPTMLFTSVVFGLLHDSGVWSVPIQGVFGFIISCVYVKNGYSYWSAVLLHMIWNAGLIFGLVNI